MPWLSPGSRSSTRASSSRFLVAMLLSANEPCAQKELAMVAAKGTFTLPPAEESETSPREIVHGCDYLVSESGDLEFYYSFLTYRWDIDGSEVRARHYLDEGASVSAMMPFEKFDEPRALST